MDVFKLREQLTQDYAAYASSFIQIHDQRIHHEVDQSLRDGIFWPNPLIQLNPAFARGGTVEEMVDQGILHPECSRIFRKNKAQGLGQSLHLHQHQREAVEIARTGHNYLLTTGTGSGKSLAYIIPIVDHVLRRDSGKGIQAIIVYPMNALANSQEGELKKFLCEGYPEGSEPVTFARYTGQEGEKERQRILANPPDILLTNYVMLELIMTRPDFLYESGGVYAAIYIDGSQHDYPNRQNRDRQQQDCLEDYGYRVIRFGYRDDWEATIRANQHIFGGKA